MKKPGRPGAFKYKTVNMFSKAALYYHRMGYKIISHSPFSDNVTFEIPKKIKEPKL